MVKYLLYNDLGYKWEHLTNSSNAYFKGFCLQDGKNISGDELFRHLTSLTLNISAFISSLDGHFSLVFEHNNEIFILTDHANSFPLYYYHDFSVVADTSGLFSTDFSKGEYKQDFNATIEFIYTGNTIHDKTLLKSWKKTIPGLVSMRINIGRILSI